MYKMIIIDLDGTLLNDQKEVSKEDAYMINRAFQEKNVISVIATGRSYVCANYIANLVGDCFAQYIIASTGSVVRDNKNGIDICKRTILNEDIIKIMQLVETYNFKCSVDVESKVIGNARLVNQQNLWKIGQSFEIIENLKDYFVQNKKSGITITLRGEKEDLQKATETLSQIDTLQVTQICEALDVTDTGTEKVYYIDIISKGSTKKEAILLLAEYLHIAKEEIIVIGDGGNDIPMFEIAGLKVAMENALDIVKEKADYITASNEESGVGKAIKKFVFGENG